MAEMQLEGVFEYKYDEKKFQIVKKTVLSFIQNHKLKDKIIDMYLNGVWDSEEGSIEYSIMDDFIAKEMGYKRVKGEIYYPWFRMQLHIQEEIRQEFAKLLMKQIAFKKR